MNAITLLLYHYFMNTIQRLKVTYLVVMIELEHIVHRPSMKGDVCIP